MLLDEVLPRWQFRERHQIAIDAPAERVMAAIRTVTWSEVPLFRVLMLIRSLGRSPMYSGRPIFASFTRGGFIRGSGFALVAESSDELVVGVLSARSRQAPDMTSAPREVFDAFTAPGFRAAMNFHVADGVLFSETRVQPTDARSGRAFRRYWMVIRPFSGVIRRVWLQAIRRRALSQA